MNDICVECGRQLEPEPYAVRQIRMGLCRHCFRGYKRREPEQETRREPVPYSYRVITK